MNKKKEPGTLELRRVVAVLENTNENWAEGLTLEEIVAVVRACWASGWVFGPDLLTSTQIDRAIYFGIAPAFCPSCESPLDSDCSTKEALPCERCAERVRRACR